MVRLQFVPSRSTGRRRAKQAGRSRARNKQVDKVMHQKAPRTTNKKQDVAISVLAKQVKLLQLSKYGDRQYQYQYLPLVPDGVPGATPYLENPLIFAANCFYNNTAIYKASVNASGDPSFVLLNPTDPIRFQKQVLSLDLGDQYQFNELNNQNTVSKVEYLPIGMKYKFRISGDIRNTDPTFRYRFTLFKLKNSPNASNKLNLSLPQTAGALWHMCDDSPSTRNYFSKAYHTIIADRWVKFNPPTQTGSTLVVNRVVEIPYIFQSAQPLKPNITTVPNNQEFWTNLPQEDIIWCLVSCNRSNATAIMPTILIERQLLWRDKHGTTQGQRNSSKATAKLGALLRL